MTQPQIFGLHVQVVPLWNVRSEFNRTLMALKSDDFRCQVESYANGPREPITAYYLSVGGPPDILLTLLMQRTIIGLEAYIPSAVVVAAAHYGRITAEIARCSKRPFATGGSSTADTYYNRLPALISSDYRLKIAQAKLWKEVRDFYESIRNPLFHGAELHTPGLKQTDTLNAVLRAYEMFAQVYEWIDWWCPWRFIGSIPTGSTLPISDMPRLPDGHPCTNKE